MLENTIHTDRRDFLLKTFGSALAAAMVPSRGMAAKTGMPGAWPGRVIAVEHAGAIDGGKYQAEPVRKMMERGMTALTGAPAWTDAWRTLFEKGDTVGIKASPVNRRHLSATRNACGVFIPSVVSIPHIRERATLHICDGVKAQYHGGPSYREQFIWEHKTIYFATDPVALDKTGLQVIDSKRPAQGMASVALSKPDAVSGGLGEFDEKKIDVRRFKLA